jgi:hypothetical protein
VALVGVVIRLILAIAAILYILVHELGFAGGWGLNGPVGVLFALYLVVYAREQQLKGRRQLALFYLFFGLMAFFAAYLAFQ